MKDEGLRLKRLQVEKTKEETVEQTEDQFEEEMSSWSQATTVGAQPRVQAITGAEPRVQAIIGARVQQSSLTAENKDKVESEQQATCRQRSASESLMDPDSPAPSGCMAATTLEETEPATLHWCIWGPGQSGIWGPGQSESEESEQMESDESQQESDAQEMTKEKFAAPAAACHCPVCLQQSLDRLDQGPIKDKLNGLARSRIQNWLRGQSLTANNERSPEVDSLKRKRSQSSSSSST